MIYEVMGWPWDVTDGIASPGSPEMMSSRLRLAFGSIILCGDRNWLSDLWPLQGR